MKTIPPMFRMLPMTILLLTVVIVAGCRSLGKPASASFASVTISNHSAEEIRQATIAVFAEAGYRSHMEGMQMVFEREGSRLNTISRDGLVAAQEGAVTMVRVRVDLVELSGSSQRLQCHAFMVSDAGDSFFEDEHKLADFRGRPYQSLLNDVADRLKGK